MSPAATVETAREFARDLERRDRARHGGRKQEVRERVARRIGISPGTLETLERGRLKRIEVWVFERLAQATLAELRQEIRRDEARLDLARQCAGHLAPEEAAAVAAGLAELRAALQALEPSAGAAAGSRAAASGGAGIVP